MTVNLKVFPTASRREIPRTKDLWGNDYSFNPPPYRKRHSLTPPPPKKKKYARERATQGSVSSEGAHSQRCTQVNALISLPRDCRTRAGSAADLQLADYWAVGAVRLRELLVHSGAEVPDVFGGGGVAKEKRLGHFRHHHPAPQSLGLRHRCFVAIRVQVYTLLNAILSRVRSTRVSGTAREPEEERHRFSSFRFIKSHMFRLYKLKTKKRSSARHGATR